MEKKNIFTSLKGIFALVAVMVVSIFVASCSDTDVKGEVPTLTNVITEPGDTVVIDKDWTMNVIRINKGDTLDITVEMENPEEKDTIHAQAIIWKQKNGYQIFENQLILTPEYANAGMSGGLINKENITDAGWDDVITLSYPTEDDNIIFVKVRIEHHRNRPFLRLNTSKIISLADPSMSTRALYKVKDAPIKVDDLLSFETEGFANDTEFDETISTPIDRDLMAEDDIDHLELVSKGTKPVDPTTVSDSVKINVVMKSGQKNEVVNYNVRKNSFTARDARTFEVTDFSGYRLGSYLGTSSYEAEKKVAERSNDAWSVYGKKELASFAETGEKSFNFEYYLYTERAQYNDSKWGITATFDYIVPEVKNALSTGANNLNTVTSDRSGKDKAVVTDNINVKYAGFTTPFSEIVYLYKEAVVERVIVDHGFDGTKTKKTWTPTTLTCKGVHFILWNDGVREETIHEWTVNRTLVNGPAYERVCKDNTNRTSKPSITDLKSSAKTHKDENGGNWSANEEKATIGAYVVLNGADNANLTWSATEYNDVVLKVGEDVLEFGHDVYDFTLNPALGAGSVKGDYMVYPYSAVLNYVFGNASAKQATDKGSILVEESRFFKEEWGKLQFVAQTTTISENTKKWDYVWSLHFYNENTKKYFVLPVILTYASPDVPIWNFADVEECDKKSYDLYNSAYYYNGVKNAVAEDNREWMQWSIAATGSEKLAYGTIKYRTAADKAWDWESAVNGRATVFTHRYELKVTDGRLFVKDTYNGKNVTDSHCVNGGWK